MQRHVFLRIYIILSTHKVGERSHSIYSGVTLIKGDYVNVNEIWLMVEEQPFLPRLGAASHDYCVDTVDS